MISLNVYIFLSFLAPLLLILDNVNVYREYFMTVVELTNSSVFHLSCVNLVIAAAFLFWSITRRMFFGSLNTTEGELLHSAIPLYIAECVVGPFYFGVSVLGPVGLASLFTLVVALLHRVAWERTKTLHIVESHAQRLRMLSRLSFFFIVSTSLDLYVVFDVFLNTTRQNDEYVTLMYFAAIMYLQFAISNARSVARLLFTVVIGESGDGSLAYFVELSFSLLRSVVFIVSFGFISIISEVPYPLLLVLINSMLNIVKKLQGLVVYYSLTRFVRSIPNATEDVLGRDPSCAICKDDMKVEQNCKQLPCGHCYHEQCLRRLFETMSTCPYCRADLVQYIRRGKAHANTAAAAVYPNPQMAPRIVNNNNSATTPTPPHSNNSNNNNNNNNGTRATTTTNGRDTLTELPEELNYEPPQEEVRRAYERYLSARVRAGGRGTESPKILGGRRGITATCEGIRPPPPEPKEEPTARETVLAPPAAAAACTASSGSNDKRISEGTKREGRSEEMGIELIAQLHRRYIQRLDAYKAYEDAVRAASETLEQRLLEIDDTFYT